MKGSPARIFGVFKDSDSRKGLLGLSDGFRAVDLHPNAGSPPLHGPFEDHPISAGLGWLVGWFKDTSVSSLGRGEKGHE